MEAASIQGELQPTGKTNRPAVDRRRAVFAGCRAAAADGVENTELSKAKVRLKRRLPLSPAVGLDRA
jgi:hypothetical protein